MVASILVRGRNCARKTSPLTRLNDVLRKTLLQEAKRNARSNDLVLISKRAPNSKPNHCAVRRRLRESGARLANQGGRGGGSRKIFWFYKYLLIISSDISELIFQKVATEIDVFVTFS